MHFQKHLHRRSRHLPREVAFQAVFPSILISSLCQRLDRLSPSETQGERWGRDCDNKVLHNETQMHLWLNKIAFKEVRLCFMQKVKKLSRRSTSGADKGCFCSCSWKQWWEQKKMCIARSCLVFAETQRPTCNSVGKLLAWKDHTDGWRGLITALMKRPPVLYHLCPTICSAAAVSAHSPHSSHVHQRVSH